MLILIDAYNVTMADPATSSMLPDDQRSALLHRLSARGRDVLGPGRIVAVFDKGHLAKEGTFGGIVVRNSGDRTADDVIVELASAEHGRVTVVTNDNELASRVRVHAGASTRVLPSSTLFECTPRSPSKRRRASGRDDGLPPGAAEITRELEREWLGEEKDR